MSGVLVWVKNFLIYSIFVSILIQLTADESYQKYIRKAAGIIVLLLFIQPIITITGNGEQLHTLIDTQQLWAQYRNEKADMETVLKDESSHYKANMEASFEENMIALLEENSMEVEELTVIFNEKYEINRIQIQMNGDGRDAALLEKAVGRCIKENYGIEGECIEVHIW
ncbi:MAG: stage III sporulation protein AF [Lachnospiraceae bacterium]